MTSSQIQEGLRTCGERLEKLKSVAEERSLKPEEYTEFEQLDAEYESLAQRLDTVTRSSSRLDHMNSPLYPEIANAIRGKRSTAPPGVVDDALAEELRRAKAATPHGVVDLDAYRRPQNATGAAEYWRDERGTMLKRLTPTDSFAAEMNRIGRIDADEYPNLSFGAFCRAMVDGARTPEEKRALAEGTDSAGGYTVPTVLMGQVIDALRAQAQTIRAGATTMLLTSDVNNIARVASNPTPGWRAENASVAESDPTFEQISFSPESLAVKVKVPLELIQDSLNIEQALTQAFAGALAAEVDRAVLRGSGSSNEPLGLTGIANVNSHSMGVNGAAITSWDEFIDVIELIRTDGVPDDITAAIMAPRTWSTLNKLKDTTNQPLQRPPAIATLPMYESGNVAIDDTQGTETDASRIFLGAWPQVLLGVRQQLRIEVNKQLYMDNLQYGFFAHLRFDVAVAHPEAMGMVVGIIP